MSHCLKIDLPGENKCLTPGCRIRIGRFSTKIWLLQHGWFTFSGNRPICGWYLTNVDDPTEVRPLQQPDLIDIYFVER